MSTEPREQFELFDYDETHNINLESVSISENEANNQNSDSEIEFSPEQVDLTTFWES